MTLEELRKKVREWDLLNGGPADRTAYYSSILRQLDYHAEREWRVYLPAHHPDFNSNYMERLAAWIGNLANEDDQKLLLEYARYINFFSHEDFSALYRCALSREVVRWVASQTNTRLDGVGGKGFHDAVHLYINRHVWFCPVTDSMDINEFFKVNHLKGVGHRPGFATLQMLAERGPFPDAELSRNLLSYMSNPSLNPHQPRPSLERIVLLEDIVGSGTQCIDALRWAIQSLGKPLLFVPLILCPNGVDALRHEEANSGGLLTVCPVVQLRRSELLGPERRGERAWPISDSLEDLAIRCAGHASAGLDAFGYLSTGCSIATFANTPDNSLPIIHNKPSIGGWEPLFPRVYRD